MQTPSEDQPKANPLGSSEVTTTLGGAGKPPQETGLGFLLPPSRPGTLGRLGHYEILEVLGRGGFGIVFRAFDDRLQRVVAIKVLSPEAASSPTARARFLREARAAAQVRHENVVQTYAVEEDPLPYLVMEFVPGETLQQRLDRTGPLDAAEVAAVGRQIAGGLAAAHGVGLIHRDVKPGNVLVAEGPRLRVKMTDFGLARAADDASITQSGVVVGTPMYMSPEQTRGDKLDQRSDLFSLGSVLYTLTSGQPPFRAGNTLAVLKRVAEAEPRPIREIIPSTPEWLCRVIARLMAKDPDQRFQTAAEVGAALEAGPAAVAHRPSRPRRRLVWLAVASAVLVAGVVMVGLWAAGFFGKSSSTESARLAGDPTTSPEKTAPGGEPPALPPVPRPVEGGFLFPGPGGSRFPAASEDGKLLAVPWKDQVLLFETPSGRRLRILAAAGGPVRGLAISSRSRLLAAWSGLPEPGRVRAWDLDTYAELYTLPPSLEIDHAKLTLDSAGTLLVVSLPGRGVRVWQARTGEEITSLSDKKGVTCFNPQGTLLALGEYEGSQLGTLSVRDTKTWKQVRPLEPPPGEFSDMHFSPDGGLLAVGTSERLVHWDTRTFDRAHEFDFGCRDGWFTFSPDGQTILALSTFNARTTHTVKRYDVRTGAALGKIEIRYPDKAFFVAALSPDGRALYVPDEPSQRVRVFDAATGEEVLPEPEGKPAPGGAAQKPRIGPGGFLFARAGVKCRPQVSRDGRLAAAPCGAGVTLFDVTSSEALRTLDSPGGDVRGVGFSPDGRRLAAFSHDPSKLRVWSLDGDKVLFTTDADNSINLEPVFSPDGTRLVVPDSQPVPCLRVLDAFTGAEVKAIPTTTRFSGRFNATGSRFAAALWEPPEVKVTVWDTADWRAIGTPGNAPDQKDNAGGVVQYSPSGKYLAALGTSGVTVWKADTLEPVGTVKAACYLWFDFLADEQTLLVQGTDGFEPVHEFVRYDFAGRKKGAFTVRGPKDYLYVSLDPAREYLWVAPYQTGSRLRIFEAMTGRELLPGGKVAPPRSP